MIYVDRTKVPEPVQLRSPRADKEREKIHRLLSGSPQSLEQFRVRFDDGLWKAARPVLNELFHGKCAYCESDIAMTGAGDVEHFRPKTVTEEPDGTRSRHYYAWLAYEWENVLIACIICNRRSPYRDRIVGKGNFFPVRGDRARPLASVGECRETEDYFLIDPCYDRPEEHLSFNERGLCVPLSERGEVTIQLLNLNRDMLIEARRYEWDRIELSVARLKAMAFRSITDSIITLDIKNLNDALLGRRPYTAAARSAFLANGGGLPGILSKLRPEVQELYEQVKSTVAGLSPAWKRRLKKEAASTIKPIVEPRRRYAGHAELPPRAHETIRRIRVRNFKALEDIDLELPGPTPNEERTPALMLLGENATGKSSVLEAVTLALLGTEHIARLGLDGEAFIRRPGGPDAPLGRPKPAEVFIYFEGRKEPVRLKIDPSSGRFEGNARPATVLLGYGPRRFFSDRRRVHRSDEQSERVRTLFDPLAVIGNPTSWLNNCNQSSFDAAIRALKDLLLLPEDAPFTRPPRGQRRGAEIMVEMSGVREPLRRLSEGYKTTVATGVDIMREMLTYWPDLESARGVVLIDEIETHLHPRWKMRIVGRLRRCMPRVQFIATTHDPLCLRGLADGEPQVLRRDAFGRVERAPDLPNVSGLSVEQLLTSEFFGLFSTEDPEFEEEMTLYAALAMKPGRLPEEDSELEQYRERLQRKVTLGLQPLEQVIQEAAGEYLAQRRLASAHERPELKQAAVNKVLDLWKSIGEEEP